MSIEELLSKHLCTKRFVDSWPKAVEGKQKTVEMRLRTAGDQLLTEFSEYSSPPGAEAHRLKNLTVTEYKES